MANDIVEVIQNNTSVQIAQVPSTNLSVTQSGPINIEVAGIGIQGAIGPIGPTGRGFNPRGAYATTTAYAVDDIVTYSNATYRVKTAHTTTSTLGTTNLELWAARGATGATGTAATIAVGTVTTGAAGSSAIITNAGTTAAAVFNFTIPKGDKGDIGNTGPAPNIAGITVATGAAGTNASGTISGTNPNYTINLTVPRGDKGDIGAQWYSGSGAPAGTLGVIGDYYIVDSGATGLGDLYKKTATSTWTKQGNIRGAAGSGSVSTSGAVVSGNLTSFSGTTGTLIQDAGFATSDIVRLSTNQTITGTKTFTTNTVIIDVGAGGLALKPGSVDHTYLAFFARTATPSTRSGFIGYGGVGGSTLNVTNEISGGLISLTTSGNGNISLSAGTGNVNLFGTTISATGTLQENGQRVYSPNNKPTDASSFTTGTLPAARMGSIITGTFGSNPYAYELRGSNEWFPVTDNLVVNPSQLDATANWSSTGGGTRTMVDSVMPDGTTARVMQSTSSGDTQNYSNIFAVDVSQAYEVRLWYKDPSVAASGLNQFYIGLTGYADAAQSVGVSYMQVSGTTGAATSLSSNFYFMNKTGATTGWTEFVGYVIPVGADTTLFAGLGSNVSQHAQFQANHKWMRLRVLNWANAGTSRDIQIAHVSVRAMDIGALKSSRNASSLTSGTIADSVLPTRLNQGNMVSDWNTALTVGFYYGNSAANAPITGWLIGRVERLDAQNVIQTVQSRNGSADTQAYQRILNTNVWGAWYKLSVSQTEQDARYVQLTSAQTIAGVKTFSSSPIVPNPTTNTQVANKSYVDTTVAGIVDSAPGTLDTLNELAAALGDDPNFATTVTNQIATKAPINSPTFTGTVGGITKAMVGLANVDNTSDLSKPISTATQTALSGKADSVHTHNVIDVIDVRGLAANTTSAVDYDPTPDEVSSHGLNAFFSRASGMQVGGSTAWKSALTIHGWSAGYSAWQLIGPSNNSAPTNDFYLRTGKDATWNNAVKIWHDGNFDPSTKANTAHTHVIGDITATGTASATTYLRGDGTWATPANTTYTAMTVAEGQTGTATTSRTVRADYLKSIIQYHAPKGNGTEIYFSTLTGANDDAKLASAISTIQALTLKGITIVLDENRDYTFTQPVTLFSGFSIRGAFRPQDQPRSSMPIGNRVLLRMATPGGWLKPPAGNVYGVSVSNLSIDGNASSWLVEGNESVGGVLWTAVFRDISVQNAAGVFGSPSNKLLVTACTIDGWWNINNVQERAFNIGGSDFYFKPSMMLLDSPDTMLDDTKFLGCLSYQSNSWWSNIYCTAEGHSALLLEGSDNSSISNWIADCVFEGRNANAPSPGALIRVNGGQYTLRDNRYAFAMTSPSATGRDDAGVIHVAKGDVLIDGATYERATGVAETVPFVYATGGKVRIRNIKTIGTWTGKPVVFQTSPGLIDADDTVEIRTATVAKAVSGDATSGASNSGTSITINKPSGTVTGDLLVAAVGDRAANNPYTTPPAGWTAVAPTTDNTAPGVIRFWYKIATASEPASYTWAGGGSGRHAGVMFRVQNFDSSAPVNAAGAVGTGVSGPERIIDPAVTTTKGSTLLLALGFSSSTGGLFADYTNATMTQVKTAHTSTGGSENAMTVLAENVGAAGSTGSRSITATSGVTLSTSNGYMIAINSAPGGSEVTYSAMDSRPVRVVWDGSAYPARPSVPYVEWVGPVLPTAGTSKDTWINTGA